MAISLLFSCKNSQAPAIIKEEGMSNAASRLIVYCSKTTHTWIEKAAFYLASAPNPFAGYKPMQL
jgi:hypothetical protein